MVAGLPALAGQLMRCKRDPKIVASEYEGFRLPLRVPLGCLKGVYGIVSASLKGSLGLLYRSPWYLVYGSMVYGIV